MTNPSSKVALNTFIIILSLIYSSVCTSQPSAWTIEKMKNETFIAFDKVKIFESHRSTLTPNGVLCLKEFKEWLDKNAPNQSFFVFASSDRVSTKTYWVAEADAFEKRLVSDRSEQVRLALIRLKVRSEQISYKEDPVRKIASEKLDLLPHKERHNFEPGGHSQLVIILTSSPDSK